jgi:hypothetical protein
VTDRPRYVIGPDGGPLSPADLPQAETTRWTPRRKAQVVCAVKGGLVTLAEASERWRLTLEEFASWQDGIANHGIEGLRSTRTQQYR